MNEIMDAERRDALVEEFVRVANADVLTNMDGLTILEILKKACERASAELEEGILTALITGEEIEEEDLPPGDVE